MMDWVKNNKKVIITLLVVIVVLGLVITAATNVYADVGNGVSRSSSRDSNRNSSSDMNTYILLLALLVKHPWLIIFLAIGYFVYKKYGNGLLKNDPVYQDNNIQSQHNNLATLKEHDPAFSEPNFITKVNNMFLQLQNSWTQKQWKGIRPFETDELFNMHRMQLQRYIDSNTTNVVDNIGIINTEIIDYETDGVNDILTVEIRARFNDYVIDDNTKKVIEGDPHKEVFMTYHWKMIRRKGVLTQINDKDSQVRTCSACGAPADINAAGVCEFCGSLITSGEYDWVLSEIEVVEQR
jgi:uncharacterized protein YneF (UPF0154 family)